MSDVREKAIGVLLTLMVRRHGESIFTSEQVAEVMNDPDQGFLQYMDGNNLIIKNSKAGQPRL